MASRFDASCSPAFFSHRLVRTVGFAVPGILLVFSSAFSPSHANAQALIRPAEAGDPVNIMPSDMAIFEETDERKDLPCSVTQRPPEIGFDLRFHSGYNVTLPLNEVAGDGGELTVVFRIYSQADKASPSYFLQHFDVPTVADDAKGDALLQGQIDMGEGNYHVDWLMRDRSERICSSSWDVDATLASKDRPMSLFISPNRVAEEPREPFQNDAGETERRLPANPQDALTVKLLVNFAPQDALSAALKRSDTEALVSILKTIQRDPRVARISLVAFNMPEARVVYRQENVGKIDFPALGRALHTMKPGTVTIHQLNDKQSETNFLAGLVQHEVATAARPDAVIFAGPKAMLKADVPQDDLRRIGDIECPVFYMNYNLNPQAVPWKDSISHVIKAFRGTEYTISRPRDLWFSTTEMMSRITRAKRNHTVTAALVGSTP
ncbi:MAG TPA: acetyltransferase [Bryobacteraceae bacterium]|jgi:hypothetical protein|nr:acetyltransferase [Bryobacteraceae bacterium]